MNARELLEHMRNGAIVRIRWQYGKQINSVCLPTGETLPTQMSNIHALIKQHKIIGIPYSGDNYDYFYAEAQVLSENKEQSVE